MKLGALSRFISLILLFSTVFPLERSLSGVAIQDYVLSGHTFAYCDVDNSLACAHRCLARDQCKSYNYALYGRQQGLCQLNGAGRNPSKSLQYKPGFVFVQAQLREARLPHSCFDHWKGGARISGKYSIHVSADKSICLDVYCDFTSEPGWVWTLVMSQSYANKDEKEFFTTPFWTDAAVNEYQPNWEFFRLSLDRMRYLKSMSTHWRVTCSFPTRLGVNTSDYVRAEFSLFDPMAFSARGKCEKVEYINVRGHECSECTSIWWQVFNRALHHDSSHDNCDFQRSPGYVVSEDNFGSYDVGNPDFRCSSGPDANTNHWFGRRV